MKSADVQSTTTTAGATVTTNDAATAVATNAGARTPGSTRRRRLVLVPGPLLRLTVARGWLWFWAIFVTLAYALLRSPHRYPLPDGSLYLSLGRSFAAGRGLTMMGDTVKLT